MLTKRNPDSTWSCQGVDFGEANGNVYGALCKLRNYEKSGFEPDDLDRVIENIHIGSKIEGYIVFRVWNDCCIAENWKAPEPYVIWTIEFNAFTGDAKTTPFKMPHTEFYKFTEVQQVKPLTKNVYEGDTNEFLSSEARKSTSERLFERFCEDAGSVEWVYKNDDSGQQYLSIVYRNGIRKQWLFYPDYIIKTRDGNVWIIETKGGMQAGYTKNIDRQVKNKFNAFKSYAKRYNI